MTVFVISIGGGGIRGAICTSFLEHMENIMLEPIHKKFSVFAGASTGALISSCIAYNDMTASEISQNLYTQQNAKKLMNKTWWDTIFGAFQTKPKYDGIGKRNMIESISKNRTFDQTNKNVIVPIYDISDERSIYIKSWKNGKNYKLASVLDATSAAPGFFPCVEYTPEKWAIDGCVVSHNPVMSAYLETLKLYPNEKDIRVLSIGTGMGYPSPKGKNTKNWGTIPWLVEGGLINLLFDGPMESEEIHVKELTKKNGHQYLSVNTLIKNTSMDDISEENIELLKKEGEVLWNLMKNDIISFLDIKTTTIH